MTIKWEPQEGDLVQVTFIATYKTTGNTKHILEVPFASDARDTLVFMVPLDASMRRVGGDGLLEYCDTNCRGGARGMPPHKKPHA